MRSNPADILNGLFEWQLASANPFESASARIAWVLPNTLPSAAPVEKKLSASNGYFDYPDGRVVSVHPKMELQLTSNSKHYITDETPLDVSTRNDIGYLWLNRLQLESSLKQQLAFIKGMVSKGKEPQRAPSPVFLFYLPQLKDAPEQEEETMRAIQTVLEMVDGDCVSSCRMCRFTNLQSRCMAKL